MPPALPESPWLQLLLAWIGCATLLAILWVDQVRKKDATLVDVGWTLGLGLSGVLFALGGTGSTTNRLLAGIIAAIWAVRLASHLFLDRVLKHRGEDSRYAYLREHWGQAANSRFFWFYQLQALAAAGLAAPYLVLSRATPAQLTMTQWAGLAIIAFSIMLESIADRQLAAWRANPANKGKTCRAGLWAYSRHPNYFFEWLFWVGLAVTATPSPLALYAWISPAVMFWLVTKVSGIPWAEQQSLRSRGDDYRRYQAEVSAFFPMPPRRTKEARS